MQIRQYETSDLADVVSLFTISVHELANTQYDAAQREAWAPRTPDLASWQARLRTLHVQLAIDEGRPAGFIGYDDSGHIDLLFTAPTRARCGVASQLYARAERSMRAAGAVMLTTEASELARPFFARHDFALVETQIVQRHGVSLQRYAMRKVLS